MNRIDLSHYARSLCADSWLPAWCRERERRPQPRALRPGNTAAEEVAARGQRRFVAAPPRP